VYSIMRDTPKAPSNIQETAASGDSCHIQATPAGVAEADDATHGVVLCHG
jgi:hypothetical protein